MALRLKIEVEPNEALPAIAEFLVRVDETSEVRWGDLGDALRTWVERVGAVCREISRLAVHMQPEVSVRQADVAAGIPSLDWMVECTARVELDGSTARKRDTLRRMIGLVQALGRLEGHTVRLRLGTRPCSEEEAVNALRRAIQSRSEESGPRQETGERYRARAREAHRGPSAGARSGAGQPGSASSSHGGNGSHRQESRTVGGMGRASVRLSPAAEFFLSSTGLCPPFTAASLKQAFRKGVGKLHPDVRPGVAEAHEEFCRFQRGYEDCKATLV